MDMNEAFETNGYSIDNEAWRQMAAKYDARLKNVRTNNGWYDLFLIHTDGDVVYTVAREPDLGMIIPKSQLKDSGLGKAFQAMQTAADEAIFFADYFPYAPSAGAQAAFMMAKMRDAAGQVAGYVALQLPTDQLNAVMQERTGLGATGESYLVGSLDGVNSLRNDRVVKQGKVGEQKTSALIELALQGKSGAGMQTGSTGEKEFVYYSPVTIEGVHWCMVTTIAAKEAFAAVSDLRTIIIVLIIAAAIVMAGLALLDITEVKRSDEKIRRLNEELQQKIVELIAAQEELVRKEKLSVLGQLSGSVGHELRNPLGVMSNAVYFLQMVLADADDITKEYLDIIKHEIDNSLRIITDLLDFARTKTPQRQAVTARALLDESLGRCALPDNVALQTEIPDNLPLLRVDPLQMGQVLQNLITNAVQAMPAGGVLTLRGEQDSEGTVRLEIADTGEGITHENMKKLYQPLFTTKSKGIGLGLVVCKNLVEANGGRIEVESELGTGTVFTVRLPIERCGT